MTELHHAEPAPSSLLVHDCWNRIGVRGDQSCVELARHVHCRNCPVHAAAATQLLDGEIAADYLAEQTALFAQPVRRDPSRARSIFIFRLGPEWLSLPPAVVVEVATARPVHTLPHRQSPVVRGLASVRGQLLVCVSLAGVIGIEPLPEIAKRRRTLYQRMLVIQRGGVRVICAVDEVHGMQSFEPHELTAVPATVARAAVSYSTALLAWRGHTVGVLDDELVFFTMTRGLA